MGNVFYKRRLVTEELDEIVLQLKKLETQITEHIESRSDFLRTLIYAVLALFSIFASYAWLQYQETSHKIIALSVLLFVAIVLFFILRLILISVYDFSIQRKQKKIQVYMEKKTSIIENVKENEKFNVAKEIIEKYSSKEDLFDLMKSNSTPQQPKESKDVVAQKKSIGVTTVQSTNTAPRRSLMSNNINFKSSKENILPTPLSTMPKLHEINNANFSRTPVRPFVQPSANPIDRILDYVMGESINNRYALICFQCRAHNGMVLREELEQISYFCFKCGIYNPSRNEKKVAQTIVSPTSQHNVKLYSPYRSTLENLNTTNVEDVLAKRLRSENQGTRTPSISSFTAITKDVENNSSAPNSTDLSTESSNTSSKSSSVNGDDQETVK